jgi:N-acetylglucosamine-6-sulfatase
MGDRGASGVAPVESTSVGKKHARHELWFPCGVGFRVVGIPKIAGHPLPQEPGEVRRFEVANIVNVRSHQPLMKDCFMRCPPILAALALVLVLVTPAIAAKQPNVLLVLCDDLRWDALGCMGHPHVQTPNIDRLAKEGVLFTNAFCTTSLCSPSRASILSGLYAHAHGVVNNFTEYPAGLISFPLRLQKQGYETGYVGKWHMGEENDAPRSGFDWFVSHKGQGKYFDTEWNVNGHRRETPKGYYTHVVTDYALDWLRQRDSGKPWMLIVGQKAPHSFYIPEPKYQAVFDNVRVPYPETAFQLRDKPGWISERRYTWHGIYGPLFEWRKQFPDDRPEAVKDFEAMTRAYWGTILSVDDSVARLRAELERRGELDKTVVLFMGDNGLLNGEHGMVDKRTAHEASLRIPLIVRYPALATGKTVEQQVLTLDIAPTVLDLCGAPPIDGIHGRSFAKLARNGDPTWRGAWFYEYNYEKQFPYTPNVRAIRTDSWKYIRYPHGDGGPDRHMAELYNVEFDPEERRNLIANPRYAPVAAELREKLTLLMTEAGLPPEKDRMPLDEGVKKVLPEAKIR